MVVIRSTTSQARKAPTTPPTCVVGRLSLYRRILQGLQEQNVRHVVSAELARLSGNSAAQVRRDLMSVDSTGSSASGYTVANLAEAITRVLDSGEVENVALVGVGNLGRALLAYFRIRVARLRVVAAFDIDPLLCGQVIAGCRCHRLDQLDMVLTAEGIRLALLVVPAPAAQGVADRLAAAGVRAIVNFAPVPLIVPDNVHLENIDMTTALERAAFFARQPFSDAAAAAPTR